MGGDGRGGERAKVNGLGRVRAQKKAEGRPILTHLRGQKTAGGFRRYQANSPEIPRNHQLGHTSTNSQPFFERLGALESPSLSLSNAPKGTKNGWEMGELEPQGAPPLVPHSPPAILGARGSAGSPATKKALGGRQEPVPGGPREPGKRRG